MYNLQPRTATQVFLASLTKPEIELPEPITRKEKFLSDLRDRLNEQYIIDDIKKLPYTLGKQLSAANDNTIKGTPITNQRYVMFGEQLLYVKAGSWIKLKNNNTYGIQCAQFNQSNGECVQFFGITLSQNESSANLFRKIPFNQDCYIRFTIRRKDDNPEPPNTEQEATEQNVQDYLDQLEIHLIIEKKNQDIMKQLLYTSTPRTIGTYILTATVDSNGNISYNWIPQQS